MLADNSTASRSTRPNDAVVHPDGGIWFTDPGYGSLMNYEGNRCRERRSPQLQRKRSTASTRRAGEIESVADELFKPNGLCFSPDYKKLYVADTGASHYPEREEHHLGLRRGRRHEARATPRTFADMKLDGKAGFADGIRADVDGNIWAARRLGRRRLRRRHVFAPDGDRIGQILLPEICSNVCFGGPKRNRLFMTASQSLYAVYVETQGAHIA